MRKGKDKSNMLTNGAIFSAFKHYTDLHTVRGRSTVKDGLVDERVISKLMSFRELTIANEWVIDEQKCGQSVTSDDR